jgi:hypothetical protein
VITASTSTVVPDLVAATSIVTFIAIANALVRLLLCGLAIYAAHRALRESDTEKCGESVRAYRLAVLYVVMSSLSPGGLSGWRHMGSPQVRVNYVRDNERADGGNRSSCT